MHGNIVGKSYSAFQVNEPLLMKVVEAIKKGEADARRYSQIRSFEIYYDGFRQRMVLGRIMVIPAKICDSVEDFPAALLYGALAREVDPSMQADLYTYRLGEGEYDEYDKKDLQVIKDKLFKDIEGKYRSIVLFVPTWGNVRDYVVLKYTHDMQALANLVRHQIYGAYYDPALSSAFDHLSNDTDRLNVSDITPKVNYPGLAEGVFQSFPMLEAGDSGSKTASAAKPRMLLAKDTADEISEEFLEPGELAVIDSLAEDLKVKVDGEIEEPEAVAKVAKVATESLDVTHPRFAIAHAFELVQKFQTEGEQDPQLVTQAIHLLDGIDISQFTPGQDKGVSSALTHLDEYMTYEGGSEENLSRAYTDLEDLCIDMEIPTPGSFKRNAKLARIEWGVAPREGGFFWEVVNKGAIGKGKTLGSGVATTREKAEAAMNLFMSTLDENQPRVPAVPRGALASSKEAAPKPEDYLKPKDLETPRGWGTYYQCSDCKGLFNTPAMLRSHADVCPADDAAKEGTPAKVAKAASSKVARIETYPAWRRAIKKVYPTAYFEGDIDIAEAFITDAAGQKQGVGEWEGSYGEVYKVAAKQTPAAPKTVVACEGATLVKADGKFVLKAASGHTEALRINASKVKWQRPLQFTLAFRAAVETFVRNPRSGATKKADVPLTFDAIWNDIAEDMGPAPAVELKEAPSKSTEPRTETSAPEAPQKTRVEKMQERRGEDEKGKPNLPEVTEKKDEGEAKEAASTMLIPSQVLAAHYPELSHTSAFNMFIPGQVLNEFRPEITRETVDYPTETFGDYDPNVGLPGGSPSGVTQSGDGMPADGDSFVATDPAAAMGLGSNGKPQILEGAPLRKELDVRGYGFDQEFYAQTSGVNPNSFTASLASSAISRINKKASTEEFQAQFADFLKKAMGEIAATFIAAFKVTSRPLMNKTPGEGEINLAEVERNATFANGTYLNVASRVAYLMTKLTDSQIQDAINGAWAQSAVWNEDSNGGYTYEVFVRPETLDKQTMILKYTYVPGTKGL